MPRPKKPIKDQIVKNWLQEFKVKHTRQSYLSSLRKFKECLNIESLDVYVESNPDATSDMKKFLISMDGKPSKSIAANISALKTFFLDNKVPFDETVMKKLRRRGFYPKRIMAQTRDKKMNKSQLTKILNYLDIKGRALVLFLLSSGARVGEAVKLKIDDLDLEADPPHGHLRAEYTKGGVGARTVFMSYEARDAIKDWLVIKDRMKKRNGGKFCKDKVFDWTVGTSTYLWNRAVEKACLDEKDDKTHRRIYHLHGLRKFFRSQIGLDVDLTHALMGHLAYLDEAYLRLDEKEIAEAYKKNMERVSIYAVEDLELRNEIDLLKEENVDLKQRLNGFTLNNEQVKKLLGRIEKLEKKAQE